MTRNERILRRFIKASDRFTSITIDMPGRERVPMSFEFDRAVFWAAGWVRAAIKLESRPVTRDIRDEEIPW